MDFFSRIGSLVLNFLDKFGQICVFTGRVIYNMITPPYYFSHFFKQLLEIGFYSLPVVGLTTFFTGAVLALQAYAGTNAFAAETTIPWIIVLAMTRELGPVMAGLMVSGRVGASIAAELGTMKVSEQIDALTTLSVNPYKYLIAPRVLAGFIALPFLVFIGDIIGVLGGYLVSVQSLGFNSVNYIKNTYQNLQAIGVISGLVKAAVFGFVITLIGCYQGYNSKGGAQGVGQATTNSVVTSSILILILNYMITELFFGG